MKAFFLGLVLLLGTRFTGSARDRVLRLASPTDPMSLDPVLAVSTLDFCLFPLLHQALLDARGTNLAPWSAESWEVSPNGLTYTFRLRRGVRFSTGREVVAADHVHAIERTVEPATGSVGAFHFRSVVGFEEFTQARLAEGLVRQTNSQASTGRWIEPIHLPGVRAPDPQTLVVELAVPNVLLPYVMTFSPGVAEPGEVVDFAGRDIIRHPVGTGPYIVAEWTRGKELVLSPNPHYEGIQPRHFDRIEVMIGGDENTHLMMFERGEIDVASAIAGIPIAHLNRLQKDPVFGSRIEIVPMLDTTTVWIDLRVPPLDNRLVRQAMNLAIDRPRRIFGRLGVFEPARGVIPPSNPAFDPGLVGYGFDPDRARRLLAESGVTLPIRNLRLWYPIDLSLFAPMALGIQADLKDVGIEVELRPAFGSEIFDRAQSGAGVDLAIAGFGTLMPDPKEVIEMLFDSRVPAMNFTHYKNTEMECWIDLASVQTDWRSRYRAYQAAEAIIVNDAPHIFLGHMNLIALRQPWLKGDLIERIWPYRFDRVWMDATAPR